MEIVTDLFFSLVHPQNTQPWRMGESRLEQAKLWRCALVIFGVLAALGIGIWRWS